MTREPNGTNPKETAGFTEKPVTIVKIEGRDIDAAHHIIPSDKPVVHAYYDGREGGIDETVPLHNVETIRRNTGDGEDDVGGVVRFGAGDPPIFEDDDTSELVTDGGRPVRHTGTIGDMMDHAREEPPECAENGCDGDARIPGNAHCDDHRGDDWRCL